MSMRTIFCFFFLVLIIACNPFKDDDASESGFCEHPTESCSEETPVVVDKTPPTLINVLIPQQSFFESDETLEITLEFDEFVRVSGILSIIVEVGRHEKSVPCIGDDSQFIRCHYTFSEDSNKPDIDFDGITFSRYDTSAGAVVDDAENEADLSILTPDLSHINVYFSGLTNWLDASDRSTLFVDSACSTPAEDGDLIGCWEDKRFSHPATNNGATRPLYSVDSAPFSRGSVYFNSDHLEYQSQARVGGDYTVVTVNNVVAFNTLNYIIGSISNVTNGIGFGFGGTWGGTAGNGLFSISKSMNGTVTRSFVSTQEPMVWGVNTFQKTAIYRNDIEALPYAVSETLVLPQTFLRVGGRDDGNTCCNNNGELAELLIFDQELSNEELQEVWCYISRKYNLSLVSCI